MKNFLDRVILNEKEINLVGTLELAFIGDSVFELYVKNHIVRKNEKVKVLTSKASGYLNARAQRDALFKIEGILNEDEIDVVKRGRNARIHTKAKNFSIEEYRHATALETLIGYLYLLGRDERLEEIFEKMNIFGEN